ncbi:hypothetical protein [Legionella fallonii]|uniref:Uncharacterized protein n=1 Tax=Legionella fallonii LLAP-10 TaxID=1212491 RepID=A0A098G620_9GAMM|nr:hypothetical protein [Legionella fallonii]CEG57953.1 conserved protein of unknown function [Legionella fallonii LLAP-10]
MFLTIEELRAQIQIAKEQLIAAATAWMDSQGDLLSSEVKKNWLIAANAATREEMQESLRENNFPFGRYDTAEERFNTETDNQKEDETSELSFQELNHPVVITKSIYTLYSNRNVAFSGLCRLTTLLDQLQELDNLLAPMELFINLKQLAWAHSMTTGILDELRFAKSGVDTLEHYRQRVQVAVEIYTAGQQNNLQAFTLFDEQLYARRLQFVTTLQCFVDSLSEGYAAVEDTRFWLIRSFGPYLPWHGMLHQLAINLFEKDGVVHPERRLQIQSSKLDMFNGLFVNGQQKIKIEREAQHLITCDAIEKDSREINNKLNSMASNCATLQFLASRRSTATYLIRPTQLMGILGLFNTLGALHAATILPLVASERQEDTTRNDLSNVESTYPGSYRY